ncbi:MAG: TonB-dependent receptor plug domain-containing protein, partial [Pseudomonadota bacterium]|nr:TonB-dependent receptor plug domain-containing protein [Pseudomonadota bacterium]
MQDVAAGSNTSPAAAIQEQTGADTGTGGTDIVVTGSRIRSKNGKIDEAVPVTTITAAELLGSRGDVSLGDALNQLPQLRSTFSQANSTGSIGTAGLNLLDLRGLGVNRTLTLINGRRAVTAVPGSYTPDVNTIPSDLVERVDVVTGGNSAIYGSDAVAGVVNFVLKNNFEGLRLRAQSGVTTYGDRGSYLLSAVAGHSFLDGRVNIAASVQYTKANPLFYSDRSYLGAYTGRPGFITTEITNAPNRNNDGIPNTGFVSGGITFGSISTGSYVLATCPLANATNAAQRAIVCTGQTTPTNGRIPYNFAFQPNGTLVRDDASQGLIDRRAIGGGVLGGLSATGVEDAMLEPGLDNTTANLLIHADLSSAFKPFAEASYSHINALQQSTQPTFISSTLNPIFSINNPFLSPQARALLVSELNPGATTFQIQRFNNDIGTRAENHSRDTYRAVLGFEGDI